MHLNGRGFPSFPAYMHKSGLLVGKGDFFFFVVTGFLEVVDEPKHERASALFFITN